MLWLKHSGPWKTTSIFKLGAAIQRWGIGRPFNETGRATKVTNIQCVHLCLTVHTVEKSRNFRDEKAVTATVIICSNNQKL